jgi:hypothetical protein
MNVAVVEPTSALTPAPAGRDGGLPKTSPQVEWIDPEGDDWFASIYRELIGEPRSPSYDNHRPDLEHWFG